MAKYAGKITRGNKQMSNEKVLSDKQADWVCYQIGEWYLKWKHLITDEGNTHRLGFAKEELKAVLTQQRM